jgi:hypothetical protein
MLPGRVRKLGKLAGYDRVSRSLIRKRSGKIIWPCKRSGKVGLTRSGTSPGTTWVSARVKFQVTRSGMILVSDSGKVSGSDSGKDLSK